MTAKKRSGWGKWLILLLLAGGGVAAWLWYTKTPDDDSADFKTATVVRGDIVQSVTANGQLSAVKNVTVGSQVSGIITALGADFNTHVTNGQVIAQIDPSTYVQNITQTEAELANAQAGLELAELNMRRASELRTNQLIAISEYDKTLVELHQAQAVVKIRDAAVKKAKVDLERTTIYAPIDGVVISRAVDVGQTVAASFNAPTLFNIANDLRNMRIEAMVSEADVGGVQEGQRVNFTVDAYFGRSFRGEITQVRFAPVTNQNVVFYIAVVDVNNDELKLRPGMTANASIITAQKRDVLKIPNGALRFRPPESATVVGLTNAPGGEGRGGGTNRMEARRGGGSGAPGGGGGGEGGERSNREEMRRRFENMSPEEREEMRNRMRTRGGGGPGGGGGGGGSGEGFRMRGGSESTTRIVYLLEKESKDGKEKTVLRGVSAKVGIADASHTEVLEGLNEGDVIVAGLNLVSPQPQTMGPSRGPMGSPFGGGGFRPR